ncbi:MAG: hypothetical protein K2Z80_35285 [Xanthobacteraceae bacterium]|nr:hypothetical protein [Xanthobacteraceae bacterium]
MSELSEEEIDRHFPHQVILDVAYYSAHNFRLVLAFCVGLSLAPRGHTLLRGNQWHFVFCFSKREDAEKILARFHGRWFKAPNVAPEGAKRSLFRHRTG